MFVVMADGQQVSLQTNAILSEIISFRGTSSEIRDDFVKFAEMGGASHDRTVYLEQHLGESNLSTFLIVGKHMDKWASFGLTWDFSKAWLALQRVSRGESLVLLKHVNDIQLVRKGGHIQGSFRFDVDGSYAGVCSFRGQIKSQVVTVDHVFFQNTNHLQTQTLDVRFSNQTEGQGRSILLSPQRERASP